MNVLLFTVDALRLDAVRKLRRWDKFTRVKGGWRFFADHCAHSHCSDPNYAAMLTGFGPDKWQIFTQVGDEYDKLLPTLAAGLKNLLGYGTWAHEPVKVPAFYRFGYDHLLWGITNEVTEPQMLGARRAIRELGEPWFGFVRLMDCHYPYHWLSDVPRLATGQPDGDKVKKAYWEAVAHVDEVLTTFIPWVLEECPDTAVFVTADHGESLGEHGIYDHLFSLYDVLVHVPMWVHLPEMIGYGACGQLTQHVDVVATVCDLLGLEKQGQGESWLPWLMGGGPGPGREWAHLVGWGASMRSMWRHRGIRSLRWKYLANWHLDGPASFQLFDLRNDPKEERNLMNRMLATARECANLVARVDPGFPRPQSPIRPAFSASEARIIKSRLEALGYL